MKCSEHKGGKEFNSEVGMSQHTKKKKNGIKFH